MRPAGTAILDPRSTELDLHNSEEMVFIIIFSQVDDLFMPHAYTIHEYHYLKMLVAKSLLEAGEN